MNTNKITKGGGTLTRRRAMMSEKVVCPYQRVEYLEVPNRVVGMKLPFVPNKQDIDIIVDFQYNGFIDGTGSNRIIIGAYNAAGNSYMLQRDSFNDNIRIYHGSTSSISGASIFPITRGSRYKLELYGNDRKYILNGEEFALKAYYPFDNKQKYGLLETSASNGGAYTRLFSFVVREEGKTTFDLIPVRIGDEGFLYNKVDGALYGNSHRDEGTKYILGPDINY